MGSIRRTRGGRGHVGHKGWSIRVGAAVLRPVLTAFTRREWIDGEKLPATGGVIVVVNHVTKIDPLTVSHLLYDHGRIPRFLAKDGLFTVRGLGGFMRNAGQIPVARLSAGAHQAYAAAIAALEAGECLVVYPEGTVTRDPGLWPMRGKSGAARLALASGAPVIPVAHWGEQEILAPYATRPNLFPPKRVQVRVGDAVYLGDLRQDDPSPESIAEATRRIMSALTDLVAQLRQERPPAELFDPAAAGIAEIGNPNKVNPSRKQKNS